jgi:hypothetical protein
MALRQFSINNCGARTGSSKNCKEEEMENIAEMGEFKREKKDLKILHFHG